MSHEATNWAVRQRGLQPATKIVLWHLADRHNPDHGCFPEQARLAADCEMSRSSLNNHLNSLEARGLIRRIRRVDPTSRKQLSTRYILGFEEDFTQEPSPNIGHGNQAEPCPNSSKNRVQNLDTNSVREPVITKHAREADTAVVDACLDACGPGVSQSERSAIRSTGWIVLDWIEAGMSLELDILPALRVLTSRTTRRQIRTFGYFTGAVEERYHRRMRLLQARESAQNGAERFSGGAPGTAGPAPVDRAASPDPLVRLAEWINSDRYCPPSAVSSSQRHELLARGLVTQERLRARQIY